MKHIKVLVIASLLGMTVFSGCEESRVSSIVPQTAATLEDLDYDSIGNHAVWVIQDQLRKANAPKERVDSISRAALAEIRYAKPVEGPLQLKLNVDDVGAEGIDAALALRAAVRGAMRAISEIKADLSPEEQKQYTLSIANSGLIVSKSANDRSFTMPISLLAQASMTEIGRNLSASGISNTNITDVMKEIAGQSVSYLGNLKVSSEQLVDSVAAIAAGLSSGAAKEGTANEIARSVAVAVSEKLASVGLPADKLTSAVREISNRIVEGLSQTSLSASILTDTKAGLSEGIISGLGTTVSQEDKDTLAQTVQQAFTGTPSGTVKVLEEAPTLRGVTLFGGISNRALTISFADVLSQCGFSPDDASRTRFLLSSIYSGELRKGDVKMFQGGLWVPGERLEWTPPLSAKEGQKAFKLTALLGDTLTQRSVDVTVYVQGANEAPVLANVNTISGGREDTPMILTYETLKGSSDLFDKDSGQVYFKVTSLENGLTLKGGVPVQIGTLVGPGEFVSWTPSANANGSLSPFKMVAYDGELESTSPVAVTVSVAPVNDVPTLRAAVTVLDGLEDSPTNFSNGRLKEITEAADVDLNVLTFKVTGINQGALTRSNGIAVNVGDVIPADETISWRPPLDAVGVQVPVQAFRVAAYDGIEFSQLETQISVQVNPVNDAPVLTTIQPFPNAVEGSPYFISYEKLLANSDLRDVDTANLKFRLVSVNGSNGEAVYLKGSTTPLAAGAILSPGDVWEWTPPSRYYNRSLQGFVVEGWDGSLASERQLGVNFQVVAVNQAPEFKVANAQNAGAVPVKAAEEVVVTYEQIATALELYDAENTVPIAEYRKGKPVLVIERVDFGVLRKNGELVLPGETTLEPGQSWAWTAPSDRLGIADALIVRARDVDGLYSRSTATYRFEVQARDNRKPTLTSVSVLQGAREDTFYTLKYEDLLSASNAADLDNNALVFRIRELKSGELKKGDTVITAGMLSGSGVLVGPGDVLTWTPVLNDFDPARVGFTVSVFDGRLDSAEENGVANAAQFVPVAFNVSAVNDVPVLGAFSTLSLDKDGVAIKEDTPVKLTFSQLYFAATKSDVDDEVLASPDPNKTFKHKFVVDSVAVGSQLLLNGVLATPGTEITSATTTIEWQPPTNAYGQISAFYLKLRDDKGSDSLTTANSSSVNVDLLAQNDAPVITLPPNGLGVVDRIQGAMEDIPFVLTYDALLSKLRPYLSDVDGSTYEFKVAPVADNSGVATLGTLSKGSTILSLGDKARVQPGDALVWLPPLHTDGVLTAFAVQAFDGALESVTVANLQVVIQPINHAPSVITANTIAAAKNVTLTLTQIQLAQVLSYADVENVKVPANGSCAESPNASFKVIDIPSGELYRKVGTDAPVKVAVGAVFLPCDEMQWKPPLNALGIYQGVRFRAYDDEGLMSPSTAMLSFDIAGSNAAPYFASATPQVLGNAKQDLSRSIGYNELLSATGALDAEGATLRFFVSPGISTSGVQSKLYKGTTLITAETEVGPGETLLWNPPAQLYGELSAFTVKVFDGEKYSEDNVTTAGVDESLVTLKVQVDRVNRVPVINTTPILAGAGTDRAYEDTFYEITTAQLQAATNASDPDLNETIRFRLSSTIPVQGTLEFEVNSTWQPVSTGTGDTLGAGYASKWRWKAPALAHGAIQAFGIQPFDGDAASGLNPVSTPVTVKVESVNNVPTLGKGAPGPLAIDTFNGIEDKVFAFNYETLFAAGAPNDVDGDVLKFKFVATADGTLYRSGMSVPVAAGDLLAPGETWFWLPPANENTSTLNKAAGHTAFTVVVNDGLADSVSALPVKVMLAPVNDIPVVGTVSKITPPAAKNDGTSTGYWISYAHIKAAVPATDVETANVDNIQYRIESVGSGTLRLGQFQTGPVVTTGKPMLISAGGNLSTTASSLNWTPPLNAFNQTFLVMTVRAWDGTDFSAETHEVRIDVTGSNAPPTLNAGFTLGSSSNRAAGTTQNTPLVISYETLKTAGNVQDTDLSTVFLQITRVESGRVNIAGTDYAVGDYPEGNAAGVLRLAPGEKLTWYPASYPDAAAKGEDGSAPSAFRFKAYDNVDLSGGNNNTDRTIGTSLVKVNVQAVNQAPVLNGTALFPDGLRNKEYQITFNQLAQALNVRDEEDINPALDVATSPTKYDSINFKVTEVLSGQYLRIGATSGSAQALSAGNDTVTQNKSIFWRPPYNGALTYDAFNVRVFDSSNSPSATTGKVSITVSGSNVAPKLTSFAKYYNDGVQDTPYVISFNALQTALGITDEDSAVTSFVVTSISNGKLMVGAKQLSAAPTPNLIPPTGNNLFNLNETLVYIPTQYLNGDNLPVFRVRAWDGFAASTDEAEVTIKLARLNQIPTLNSVQSLTGATQNQPYEFTYYNLRDKTDAYDYEESLLAPTKNLRFKVASINSGLLKRASNTSGGAPYTYDQTLGAESVIDLADRLAWEPALNANGLLNAFSIVAYDTDNASSQQPIPVYINTSAVNNLPVFSASSTFVSGAREDIPFVISYQMIKDAYPGTDVESGETLTYQITAVDNNNGTLLKAGTQVVPPAFVFPGESVTWTPSANKNSDNSKTTDNPAGLITAFTVKLRDNNPVTPGVSVASKNVEVAVAAVNDQPYFTNAGNVAQLQVNATKNQSAGYPISFAAVRAVLPVFDVENANDDIEYYVESVNSGTLCLGSTNACVSDPASANNIANIALPNKGILVSALPSGTKATDFNWTPPKNATGDFLIMRVRARDKDGEYTATARDVKVTVTGSNYVPTILSSIRLGEQTLEQGGATTVGTSQNVPLLITYDTLLKASRAADQDETPLYLQITELKTGTLKVGSTTYTPAVFGTPLLVSPGEWISWKPAAEKNGVGAQALDAFVMKAYDNQASSSDCLVQVNVAPVNQPPTLLSQNVTPKSGPRNGTTSISFLELAQDLQVADPDVVDVPVSPDPAAATPASKYAKVLFKVEQIGQGQQLKKGTDPTGTGAVTVGVGASVGPGEYLFWTPPSNKTGVFNAVSVTVWDRSGALTPIASIPSVSMGTYRVDVQGVNVSPVLNNANVTLGNAKENEPYTISWTTLKTQAGLQADPDSETTWFVVTDVQNGVLKKNGTTIMPFTSVTVAAPADARLGQNEDMVFVPNQYLNNTNGDPVIFKMRAFDGTVDAGNTGYSSTEVTVKLTLDAVNQIPQMSVAPEFKGTDAISEFSSVAGLAPNINTCESSTPKTCLVFDHAKLLSLTNATDVEVGQSTQTLMFRVKSKVSGTLEKSVSGGGWATVSANVDDIQAVPAGQTGEKWRWTPDVDSNGILTAFTIVARDSAGGESVAELPVTVQVNSVNNLPYFANTLPVLPLPDSGTEDSGLVITHEMLRTAFPGLDSVKEPGLLSYAIVAAPGTPNVPEFVPSPNNSSFKKNGVSVDPAILPASPVVIQPGESVVWTPALNQNGSIAAFDIRLLDSAGGFSVDSKRVVVNVVAVNDSPVIVGTAKLRVEMSTFSLTGTITTNSDFITNISDTKDIDLGMNVSGDGIPFNATVISKSSDRIQLSAPANKSGTQTIKYTTRTDAAQNSAFIFKYSDIKAAVAVQDVETTNLDDIQYIIESVNSGNLYLGNDKATSPNAASQAKRPRIVFSDTDTDASTTQILAWDPPRNALGEYNVMTVRAVDIGNPEAFSAQAVEVRVMINGNNQKPTITTTVSMGSGTSGNGYTKQNIPAYIDYATLRAATNAADADDQPVYFRFTEIRSGTLTIGSNSYTPGSPLIPIPVVGPGERFVWRPVAEAHSYSGATEAALEAFKLVATDNIVDANATTPVAGLSTSAEATVSIWVDKVNQAPKINANA
ncbi:MAG: hypothetical protein ACO3A4_02155, partial [Silvanigrellaceae bacterium]